MADVETVDRAEAPVAPGTSLSVTTLFDTYIKRGPHPEYVAFERAASSTRVSTGSTALGDPMNSWDLIADAIEGKGGFADGSYIVPHRRERGAKLVERLALADYDNFAKTICDTPWNYISQERDAIKRATDVVELQDFFSDVDRHDKSLTDFWEYPARQARSYGTAWVFLDRPDFDPLSQAQNLSPDTRPYAYCVATRDVVYWEYDDDYELTGVVVQEWTGVPDAKPDFRVWTRDGWAVFRPIQDSEAFSILGAGLNEIGVVPAVQLFDEDPGPGRGLGRSVMLSVARIARTVYNLDSEAREVIRKSAFAMLAIPSKDLSGGGPAETGTENVLLYDKDGGMPGYVEPTLNSLDKIAAEKKAKKEAAYAMSHMAAMMGFETETQTSSGFHAQTVFDKTNKRIAKFAASLETAEMKLAGLFLLYMKRSEKLADLVSVSYPKDFNLKDLSALQDRTEKRLLMNLGVDDAIETLKEFYSALYPRWDPAEVEALAQKSAQARVSSSAMATAAALPPATPQQRARKLIAQRATA